MLLTSPGKTIPQWPIEEYRASAVAQPLPAVLSGAFVSEQVFRLEVSGGVPGLSYDLMASSNLRQWSRVASYQLTRTDSATVSVAPAVEREFYRLQLGDDRSPRAFGFVRLVVPGRDAAGAGGTADGIFEPPGGGRQPDQRRVAARRARDRPLEMERGGFGLRGAPK